MHRTPKLIIIFKMAVIPISVTGFWALMFCLVKPNLGLSVMLGGSIAVFGGIAFCWGVTNLLTFLFSPREYRLWRKGGGDPFFDTLGSPLNNDPQSVRYQELYQEKARLELEELMSPLQEPSSTDFTRGLNDLLG